jgi:hypothetical protein
MKQRAASFEPSAQKTDLTQSAAFMASATLTPPALRSRKRRDYQDVIQARHGRILLSMEKRFATFPSNQCGHAVRQCGLTYRP